MDRFDEAYRGVPPWDIGRPQAAFVALEDEAAIVGKVLDVGCGTGENALFAASRGHPVAGIDASQRAIAKAKEKAAQRGLDVAFRVHDALHLETLPERFDTIIDSGLFHIFDDRDRARYVGSLRAALRPGGGVHVLCFSDEEPTDWGGPRRVFRTEIEEAFAAGWTLERVMPAAFETRIHPSGGGKGWLATARREG